MNKEQDEYEVAINKIDSVMDQLITSLINNHQFPITNHHYI